MRQKKLYPEFLLPAEGWRAAQMNLDQRGLESRAPFVAEEINELCPASVENVPTSEKGEKISTDVGKNGIALLGNLLPRKDCDELVDYFISSDCYNAHVYSRSDKIPQQVAEIAKAFPFGSYELTDIVNAPHLLELANQPYLLAAAKKFLGCTPTIYSMNAWWSFPYEYNPQRITQSYHRDIDDYRFLSLFVYLTDVDEQSGPHQYLQKTHTVAGLEDRLLQTLRSSFDINDTEIKKSDAFKKVMSLLLSGECYLAEDKIQELLGPDTLTVKGQQGTAILTTPAGFHRGLAPSDKPRLMIWARYGMHHNFVSKEDGISPVVLNNYNDRLENSDLIRYVNRLIVDPA